MGLGPPFRKQHFLSEKIIPKINFCIWGLDPGLRNAGSKS